MPEFKPGEIVEARSGTQGWVKGKIVGEYDVLPQVRAYLFGQYGQPLSDTMTQGQRGYMVRFTEGKHAGETIKLPGNYLRPSSGYHEYMGYSGEYDAQGNRRMGPMAPDRPSYGTCSCGRPITTKGMRTCGRRECIERLHK